MELKTKQLIFIIIYFMSNVCCLNLKQPWNNDVYSGRHFEDLITQTKISSPEIIHQAILVIYSPGCESKLNDGGLHRINLPPYQYMIFAKYDYLTCPLHIWYKLDSRDDLYSRYQPKSCPEYLYFAKGTTHHDQPQRYDKHNDKNVLNWIWNKLKIKVIVTNQINRRILVQFWGKGPKLSVFVIEPDKKHLIETYVSYIILISDMETQEFLHGEELTNVTDNTVITIKSGSRMGKLTEEWLLNAKREQEKKTEKIRNRWWIMSRTKLLNFIQPVLLEKFTHLGYKKDNIPKELYGELINFYKSNIKNRYPEKKMVEPTINDSEVKCSVVKLSGTMIQRVAEEMQPIMEEWCNCKLQLSFLYGIREYYTGNILRNHVDRTDTHIVSAILQIDKDLDDQPDWELEIIGFDGKRMNVTLQPGEMLLYESATLIHGRPFPFQGKVFANAFLHYMPVEGWGWNITNKYLVNNGAEIIRVDVFASPETYLKEANLEIFSKKLQRQAHGEL